MKSWQSCKPSSLLLALLLAFKMQRQILTQTNTLPTVPASHLLALTWNCSNRRAVFFDSVSGNLTCREEKASAPKNSVIWEKTIFSVYLFFKKPNYSTSTLFIECFCCDGHESCILLPNFHPRWCCYLKIPVRESLPDTGWSS